MGTQAHRDRARGQERFKKTPQVPGELRELGWRLLFPRQEGMGGNSMANVGDVASSNMGQEARILWSQASEDKGFPF